MSDVIKTYRCPICHKLAPENKYKPFCSKRCADIDLGNWFNESYHIPAVELNDAEIEQLQEAVENKISDED